MATEKNKRGLGNPVAIAAATKAAPSVKEAAKKVNEDTKGALSWVTVAGVGLGVGILGYIFWNVGKTTKVIGSAADAASSALDNLTDAINDPNLNSSDTPLGNAGQAQITITEAEAQNRANLLLDAMSGLGTDFQRVKFALSNITVADYVLIAEKFGTPRYDGFSEATWPFPKRNLSYWIAAELDNSELNQIRALLPGMF